MGREFTQQTTPDLFSTDAVRDVSVEPMERSSPSKRHVLPENLDHAVKQLNDDELMQLLDVALKEAKQRGKSPLQTNGSMQRSRSTVEETQNHRPPKRTSSRKQVDAAEVMLSPGKLNAVRAAFKAGVTPARIARQFGVSQKNVRKALASESDDRKQ
jgi:predicted DNA-binding protein (UPF0251 family)